MNSKQIIMPNLFNKIINERQFNFQPYELGEEIGYHVDVKDEEGTRWEFRMCRYDDKWKLDAEKLPSWIADVEPILVEVIDEHE